MGKKLCLVIERPILNLGATLNVSENNFRIVPQFLSEQFQNESFHSYSVGP